MKQNSQKPLTSSMDLQLNYDLQCTYPAIYRCFIERISIITVFSKKKKKTNTKTIPKNQQTEKEKTKKAVVKAAWIKTILIITELYLLTSSNPEVVLMFQNSWRWRVSFLEWVAVRKVGLNIAVVSDLQLQDQVFIYQTNHEDRKFRCSVFASGLLFFKCFQAICLCVPFHLGVDKVFVIAFYIFFLCENLFQFDHSYFSTW